MIRDAETVRAHERLVAALEGEILQAADAEVLESYAGHGGRVVADALRQRIRGISLGGRGDDPSDPSPVSISRKARIQTEDTP